MKTIQFTQDYFVYPSKRQGIYSIQEIDWNRLKASISQIIPEKKVYHFFSSLFFGVFISSVFFIISLNTLPNLPNWILPTSWAISIPSLIIGGALIIIDNQQKKIIKLSSKFILEEMRELEEQFDKG